MKHISNILLNYLGKKENSQTEEKTHSYFVVTLENGPKKYFLCEEALCDYIAIGSQFFNIVRVEVIDLNYSQIQNISKEDYHPGIKNGQSLKKDKSGEKIYFQVTLEDESKKYFQNVHDELKYMIIGSKYFKTIQFQTIQMKQSELHHIPKKDFDPIIKEKTKEDEEWDAMADAWYQILDEEMELINDIQQETFKKDDK